MNKFRNKYRIPSARLIGYDYGSHGFYYVTICTKDKICFFGQASLIGNIANEYWLQIPLHFPFIELDEFIIMPNHLHGILFFNKPDKSYWASNKFGSQSQNLGSVIRSFKSSIKRYANQNNIDFAWQNGYYDRIIRNERELNNIRQYIADNPDKWAFDNLNP